MGISDVSSSVQEVRDLVVERRRRIEAGEICPCCYFEDCDRDIKLRPLHITEKTTIGFRGCFNAVAAKQKSIDAQRQLDRNESIAGLRLLAHVPQLFADKGFIDFRPTMENGQALLLAKKFSEELPKRRQDGRGLMIVGLPGRGKTHLGCAILNAAIDSGVNCRYFYMPQLLDTFREKYSDETLTKTAYNAISETSLLMLDELGLADAKDPSWAVSVYTKIIDDRYRNPKPTVLTSNLGLGPLKGLVGERVMSRIIDRYDIVEIKGPDYRLVNAGGGS